MNRIYDNKKSYDVIKNTVEAEMLSILNSFGDISVYQNALVKDQKITGDRLPTGNWTDDVDRRKLLSFELIWCYWMEQSMLVQTMNVISLRFQNIYNQLVVPIARFDLSPLRPLSHVLWAYLQDEQFRLSIKRRVLEYDHEYGLSLSGKAVSPFRGIDSRGEFLESFHNLLTAASTFYNEFDDKTRVADPFPLFNNLKELHLIMSEGNTNAYGDLTWVARKEMLIQQRILSATEIINFLGGKPMVRYPGANNAWIGVVETMRQLQGWGNTNLSNYIDLAESGERILLTVRYGDWNNGLGEAESERWATTFKDDVKKYIYAYRSVTGVDLSFQGRNSMPRELRIAQPSILIQRKLAKELGRRPA